MTEVIDSIFIVAMALAVFKGFTKGFVVAVLSFLAYFIGLAAALKLSSSVAQYIAGKDHEPSAWMPVISFMLVFVAVALAINLIARAIRSVVKASAMGWLDRLGGVIFFLIIYIFIFSILIFYASEINMVSEESRESSRIYPYVAPVAPAMINTLGKIIPVFKDMFEELKMFFENLNIKK